MVVGSLLIYTAGQYDDMVERVCDTYSAAGHPRADEIYGAYAGFRFTSWEWSDGGTEVTTEESSGVDKNCRKMACAWINGDPSHHFASCVHWVLGNWVVHKCRYSPGDVITLAPARERRVQITR